MTNAKTILEEMLWPWTDYRPGEADHIDKEVEQLLQEALHRLEAELLGLVREAFADIDDIDEVSLERARLNKIEAEMTGIIRQYFGGGEK